MKSSNPGTSSGTKKSKARERPIAVIDFETDPFMYGRVPRPFAGGYFDGSRFVHFWGDDCIEQLCAFLETLPPSIIYAHNGGRFDFFFLLERLSNPLRIIAGRIVSAKLGRHELRDSFAILPVPLASYDKTEIDYRLFERGEREAHRAAIVDYLRDDCVNLHELVSAFDARFGRRLTIASTAMAELRKVHEVEKCGDSHDAVFRPFYFGGRVECFEVGELRDDFVIADVNSMYPHAMANFDHPGGRMYECRSSVDLDDPRLSFAIIDATSRGALPVRTKLGLSFPSERGAYYATAHEIRAGIETGRLVIHRCVTAYYCEVQQRFDGFVQQFMADKIDAEQRGDKAGRLLAKLALNSAYGKFAQDPANFAEYWLRRPDDPLPDKGFDLYSDFGFVEVWRKPSVPHWSAYYDCAIAASITGAARAELLRAIDGAERPVYCDTDSLIARKVNAPIHATRLGAWKIEETADRVAIAGKKLYSCSRGGEWVKWACKGVDIAPTHILDIARGHVHDFKREAPSFTLKQTQFIQRKVKRT